jgi:hypothetical protein
MCFVSLKTLVSSGGLLGLFVPALLAQTTLVPWGVAWRYLDDGSDQGNAWRTLAFEDAGWPAGTAPLGYGDAGLATTNGYGPDPNDKFITIYYRHTFPVADAAAVTNLAVRLVRDDGAVVYLNDVEVFRNNLPAGPVGYRTLALGTVSGTDETNVYANALNPALLVSGPNVVAVEVHQDRTNSSDTRFNLSLIANFSAVPPVVNLTAPTNGAVTSTAQLTLNATATDVDAAITLVEFFADDAKLGEDGAAPYSLVWSNVPLGAHVLTAVATDNTGLSATSPPMNLTQIALLGRGSAWSYLDDGSDQGSAWRQPDFNDGAWDTGPAKLGFGDASSVTLLNRTNSQGGTNLTFYFRRDLEVPDPAVFSNLVVRLLRDDGGIVYLNGMEIFRNNMAAGPVSYLTLAASVVAAPQESQFYATNLPATLLQPGRNVLAVEIHQALLTSSDIGFDLEVIPDVPPQPPVVVITSPTNGASFVAPTNLTLQASATDYDGVVRQVAFYRDGNLLGQDTTEPFSLEVSNLTDGVYTFLATALDCCGHLATSAPVTVRVATPPIVTTLVATGAVWRYLDDGSNQGTNWSSPGFDDQGWPAGQAKFGTNDPATTIIHIGPGVGSTNVTTYFRKTFQIANAALYTNLAFEVLRDDGVVVHLNGQELFRMNMPDGPVTYQTSAASAAGGTNETYYFPANTDASRLREGTNVLAVELHQWNAPGTSWDAGFDLGLVASAPPVMFLGGERTESGLRLLWTAPGAVLQEAAEVDGPWADLTGATSPYTVIPTQPGRFYRLKR